MVVNGSRGSMVLYMKREGEDEIGRSRFKVVEMGG